VVARIRRTEFEHAADGSISMPAVRAVALGGSRGDGAPESVRLWPTTEPGVFEGRFSRTAEGAYSIHVTAGRAQNVTIVLEAAIPESVGPDEDEASIVASATGGAVATATDLTPIVEHLRSLARIKAPTTIHPMRSGWWTLPFTLALCTEWALRRRRGAL
jgi:hypothetical protein